MKRILLVLLASIMCISVCACNETKDETPQISVDSNYLKEESSQDESLTVDKLMGYWQPTTFLLGGKTIAVNYNSTFDWGDEKGLCSILNNELVLSPRYGEKRTFGIHENLIYDVSCKIDKDNDYGLGFSPDENGRTNQSFTKNTSGFTITKDCDYTHITIEFRTNDSCTIKLGWLKQSGASYYLEIDKTFDGYYTYSDSVILINCGEEEFDIIVGEDGELYYHTFLLY